MSEQSLRPLCIRMDGNYAGENLVESMMAENIDIEIRSEEVQEILGAPPAWLIRWGITLMTGVVLLLLLGSYIFKYPDIITGRVTIISRNPPATLVARANGKIDHLFVEDQQRITAGQVLAILENPARYTDVLALRNRLDTIRIYLEKPEELDGLKLDDNLQLGLIQSAYSSFVAQCTELVSFSEYDLYRTRIETLSRQVSDQERYLQQLTNQARILDDKLQLSRRQLDRDTELARQNVISASDLEKTESEYLQNELNHRTAVANLTSTRNQINQMQRQVAELRAERGEQLNKLLAGLREKFDNLVSQISAWEMTYVFRAPIAGTVTFTSIWSENQQVSLGNAVFSVVPDKNLEIIGRLEIPLTGSGKVEPGQRVKVKLDNFPYMEYGMLEGRISTISLVPSVTPQGAFYTAELDLPGGLRTNYKIDLAFNQEMMGSAEVITKDRRLLERLVQPLTSVVRDRILTH